MTVEPFYFVRANRATSVFPSQTDTFFSRSPLEAHSTIDTITATPPHIHINMILAKRFKLGLGSCWGNTAAPSTPAEAVEEVQEEEEVKPYDFSKHPEHNVWRFAVAASAASKHQPAPEGALVPWSHAAAAEGATSDVCTLAPAPGAGLATLFLRTTLSPTALAKRLHTDFFEDSKLSVKVSSHVESPLLGRSLSLSSCRVSHTAVPTGLDGAVFRSAQGVVAL